MSARILEHPGRAELSIARKCMEAMDTFRDLRAKGMEFDEAVALLEQGLRAAIPAHEDTRMWTAPCARCDGTGWEPYERWVSLYQENRRYVRYCECSRGQAMKASRSNPETPAPKRLGWTRV